MLNRLLELSAGADIFDEMGDLASDFIEKEGGVRESLLFELELVGVIGFFSFGGDFVSDSEFVTIGLPCAACWRIFALLFLNHTYSTKNILAIDI